MSMTVSVGARSTELVLAAAVARRYYLREESKVEIAKHFGISRFKVARLLETARDNGIVRIEILPVENLDLDLSARLEERFGLRHSVVVQGDFADAEAAVRALAGSAAGLVGEILKPGDVLGLPWSRTVDAMTRQLPELPQVDVVQISGAVSVTDLDSSAVDMVRRAARRGGGTASVFFAPLLLAAPDAADALRRDPAVHAGLEKASEVTVAVMGVGAWVPGQSTIHDAVSTDARQSVSAMGVVGEMAGVFFDGSGAVVRPEVADRLVTLTEEALRGIEHVIAVAASEAKARALRAAIDGRLIDSLVCDTALAEALLAP